MAFQKHVYIVYFSSFGEVVEKTEIYSYNATLMKMGDGRRLKLIMNSQSYNKREAKRGSVWIEIIFSAMHIHRIAIQGREKLIFFPEYHNRSGFFQIEEGSRGGVSSILSFFLGLVEILESRKSRRNTYTYTI